MPKEQAPCKYLLIIILDSVIKANKEYNPQTLLEECKYKQKKRTLLMMILKKVTLMKKQNLIMIMIMTNKFKRNIFNTIKA